jgi:hypothetical protein
MATAWATDMNKIAMLADAYSRQFATTKATTASFMLALMTNISG